MRRANLLYRQKKEQRRNNRMLRDVAQRDELTLGIAASGAVRSSRGSVLTFYSEGNRYVIRDQTDNVDGHEKEEQCMFICFF